MAEIGLVASVAQIADTGIKLSITLYTFAETVLTADKSIREIASDVSLTSSVLEELGQNLKKDQKSRLCSENAVQTAEGIVKECAAIFNEINGTLESTLEKIKPRTGSEKGNGRNGTHGGRKMAVAALERLKWPFLQPKMQLLRSNLDRLKSTLVLMLNVITYARKVSEDHATPSTLEDQRKLIEDLARSNQEYTRKFKELTKAIEAGQDNLEAVKPIPTMENVPSSGFLQANMALPPSESVHVGGETSPDITSRLTTLAKQHLPPDVGGKSDELAHYCLLINHLLQRIDAVQYKIKSDLRRRIRSDVVHMHQREADQLKDVHGHRHFTTVMGSAISWAEILHATESGASQTLRDLIYPDRSGRDWKNLDALLERGDDFAPPSFPTTSISGLERRGELTQHERRVERMIALERLMRPSATGEEDLSHSSRVKPNTSSCHSELDGLSIGALATTGSSRWGSGLKLEEPEPLKHKYTGGIAFPTDGRFSRQTANPLDQERARVKKALDDRRENSLSMMIFSEAEGNGEGSGVLLAGDLRILEALTSIRAKILDVASSEQMVDRSRPTGSASEVAEDTILTAQKLWHSIRLIHENTHGQIPPADEVLAVARLAKLVLESAHVKAKAWSGLTDIDRKIDRILDGKETQYEAMVWRETLRKASKNFALLTSSQRHALQEAWSPGTKYKEKAEKGWKQVQMLSRSITSLSTSKRRKAQKAVAEAQSKSPPKSTEYPIVHELPADGGSNPVVQHNAPERMVLDEAPFNVIPFLDTDEQNEEKNELYPPQAGFLVQSKGWRSADDNWSTEALSQGNSDEGSLMEFSCPLRFEEASPEDLSDLGSWATECPVAPPDPRSKAEDAEPAYKGYADDVWDSDDDVLTASHASDAEDHRPQGIMPPVTRPHIPDIVSNLLAQWTTLPR